MKSVRIPITFEGGLVTETERTGTPPNTLQALTNWDPEPDGCLRVRQGWRGASETSAPTNKQALGLGCIAPSYLFSANADSTTQITIRQTDNNISSYTVLDTISGLTTNVKDFPVSFVIGADEKVYYTHPRFALLRSSAVGGAGAVVAAGPTGSYSLAAHAERLFSVNYGTNHHRLVFSALGDFTTWPAGNYIDVGYGDDITCLTPHAEGLLIGKQSSVWFLRGTGPDTFSLSRLDGGHAIYGASICSTPFGAVIVGTNDVFLWNGGPVVPIDGQPKINTPMGSGSWVSTAYDQGKVYITFGGSSAPTDTWVWDFILNAWGHETGSATPQVLMFVPGTTTHNLYGGTREGSTKHLVKRNTGTRGPDTNWASTTNYTATTANIIPNDWGPTTFKHLYLRLPVYGTGTNTLTITPYSNGTAQTAQTVAIDASVTAIKWQRIDLGFTSDELKLVFSLSGSSGGAACSISNCLVLVEIEEPR